MLVLMLPIFLDTFELCQNISNNKIPDLAANTTIYIYLSDNILTNIDMK